MPRLKIVDGNRDSMNRAKKKQAGNATNAPFNCQTARCPTTKRSPEVLDTLRLAAALVECSDVAHICA